MLRTQLLLQINWADLAVLGVIVLLIIWIIRGLYRDKKAGRCPGCGSCPHAKACPNACARKDDSCSNSPSPAKQSQRD